MWERNYLTVVFTILAIWCDVPALGAQPAFDSAADSAYNTGWLQGSDGGFGWGGGWDFTAFPVGAPILGDSTTNGNGDPEGDGDINSPRVAGGRAWGLLYGNARRAFNGPLSPGQTFSIDFDDSGARFSLNYQSDVYLTTATGAVAVGVEANESNDYRLRLSDGTILDSGVPETDQGIHISFTQLSSAIQVTLTPYIFGANSASVVAPYNGQVFGVNFGSLSPSAGSTTQSLTPYINNMAITPEPSGMALIALASGCVLSRRRRRNGRPASVTRVLPRGYETTPH